MCLACRYQQIATAAYDVVCQQQQQQQQQSLSEGQSGTLQQQQQQGKPSVHPALVGAAAGPWPANSNSSSNVASLQGTPAAAAPSAAVGGMMQVLEGTAQEVFRVLLFLVFTLEVFLVSLLPFIGEPEAAHSTCGNRLPVPVAAAEHVAEHWIVAATYEVFPVLLFVVFTLKVYLISLLPFVGEVHIYWQWQEQH
jgi:hypothetical protein